jgi:hypothetical protein
MKCPTCKAEMLWGRFSIETTIPYLENKGDVHLFFRAPGRERVAIEQRTGFRCQECETFVMCKSTANDTEAQCLACGAVMAAGVAVCPQCGWTYEAPPPSAPP